MKLVLIFSIFSYFFAGTDSGFVPAGPFDIGPGDLAALCPMVKDYMDTGETPTPGKIQDVAAGPDCVYFKWNSCPPPKGNPEGTLRVLANCSECYLEFLDKNKLKELELKPCGFYEMKKCSEKRRRKRTPWYMMNNTEEWADKVEIDFMSQNDLL